MSKAHRHVLAAGAAVLVLGSLSILGSPATASPVGSRAATTPDAPAAVPPAPAGDELKANPDSSITITWPASPGATSYNLYRGTTSGGEGNTPIATTTGTTYTDKNLSPTPIYFYEISAVNASGESARTPEDASKHHRPSPPAAMSPAFRPATARSITPKTRSSAGSTGSRH